MSDTNEQLRQKIRDSIQDYISPQHLDILVTLINESNRTALEQGASIAAEQINGELGLEMTTKGSYYLKRHQRQSNPTKEKT